MTATITTCFILIGIIGFLQVADDLGVWVRIDRLCKRGMYHGKGQQLKTEIILLNPDYAGKD